MKRWLPVALTLGFLCAWTGAGYCSSGLAVEKTEAGRGVLTYDGKPLFAFGAMSELLPWALELGSKDYDLHRWAAWQEEHGMNYVRGYPEAGPAWCPVETDGRIFPFKTVSSAPLKFDLTAFNPEYWENFRQVTKVLAEHGVIVHLQLYQQCYFEDNYPNRWNLTFWNPANNVNAFTRELTPNADGHHPFIEAGVNGNRELLANQMAFLEHVLEAVGDLGNVFLDLSNEMGDGGLDQEPVREWIDLTMQAIAAWERRRGLDILVGIDYTHLPRELARHVLSRPDMELIITHGERIAPEGSILSKLYGKPLVCVNSIDKNRPHYIYYGQKGNDVRLRRFNWRAFFGLCQGVGNYSGDLKIGDPYGFDKTGEYARILRSFVLGIQDYGALHSSSRGSGFSDIIIEGPGVNRYLLESPDEAVIYLEGYQHQFGKKYTGGPLKVLNSRMNEGPAVAVIYNPATGKSAKQEITVRDRAVEGIILPDFVDDIAVHIYR